MPCPVCQHNQTAIIDRTLLAQAGHRSHDNLPQAFQAMTENRQSLKVNLFAPCPEPEPEPDHPPGLSFETHNRESENPVTQGDS
jgi:hypothetical protein